MKKIFTLFVLAALLVSCNSSDIESPIEDKKKVAVKLKVEDFTTTIEPMMDPPLTINNRDGSYKYKGTKTILCIFTDNNGIVKDYAISYYEEEKEKFGEININIPTGEYTVYTIGHSTNENFNHMDYKGQIEIPTIGMNIDKYNLSKANTGFYSSGVNICLGTLDIIVEEGAQYPPIMLKRIIGQLAFDFTDEVENGYYIDINIKHLIHKSDYYISKTDNKISGDEHSENEDMGWFKIITGMRPVTAEKQDLEKVIVSPAALFGMGDFETSVAIRLFYAPEGLGKPEKSYYKRIDGVKIQNNKITTIRGSLMEGGDNIRIHFETKWDKEGLEYEMKK